MSLLDDLEGMDRNDLFARITKDLHGKKFEVGALVVDNGSNFDVISLADYNNRSHPLEIWYEIDEMDVRGGLFYVVAQILHSLEI